LKNRISRKKEKEKTPREKTINIGNPKEGKR